MKGMALTFRQSRLSGKNALHSLPCIGILASVPCP